MPEVYEQKPVKTVLAIDATGSMSDALATTKISLADSFTRIYDILKKKQVLKGF